MSLTDRVEDDAGLHYSRVQSERFRREVLFSRAGLRQIGIRSVFLSRWLHDTRPFEHVAFPVDPSVSDVFDDEGDEQASDQDSSCGSLVFDAFYAVVGEEELRVREELFLVSGCLLEYEWTRGTYMHDRGRDDYTRAELAHSNNQSTVHADFCEARR